MEEDDRDTKTIPEWVELEYRVGSPSFLNTLVTFVLTNYLSKFQQMLLLSGKDSQVYFTHLSKTSVNSLSRIFEDVTGADQATGKGYTTGILELAELEGVPLDKICLLDPKAKQVLSPDDGDGRFSLFLFGVSFAVGKEINLL